jgi:hypothetical protein
MDTERSDPASRARQLEELDADECLRLLGTAAVGRLAVSVPTDSPLVVPVNYVLVGRTILFRSGFGTKLRALASRPVSFEVDDHDPATRTGWSVLVRGRAREARERDVDPPLPEPWVPDDKPYLVQLEIRSLTGRRIVSTRSDAPGSTPTQHANG